MTYYIISAYDKTFIRKSQSIWIFTDKEKAQESFEILCDNKNWTTPDYKEVNHVFFNEKML